MVEFYLMSGPPGLPETEETLIFSVGVGGSICFTHEMEHIEGRVVERCQWDVSGACPGEAFYEFSGGSASRHWVHVVPTGEFASGLPEEKFIQAYVRGVMFGPSIQITFYSTV